MSNLVSKALGERFTFTINNATAGKLVIAILAAFFDTITLTEGTPNTIKYTNPAAIVAAGLSCDHVLDDGTIITNLTATSANSKKSIKAFREYIKHNGRLIDEITIQANNAAAFNEVMEVIKCSPLGANLSQDLPLSVFYSVDQSLTTKINVRNLGLEIGYDTVLLLPVNAGHEVTISMTFVPQG